MSFIPREWIIDAKNETVIHDILDKYLYTDINVNIDPAITELTNIGELTIAKKLKDGLIMADS